MKILGRVVTLDKGTLKITKPPKELPKPRWSEEIVKTVYAEDLVWPKPEPKTEAVINTVNYRGVQDNTVSSGWTTRTSNITPIFTEPGVPYEFKGSVDEVPFGDSVISLLDDAIEFKDTASNLLKKYYCLRNNVEGDLLEFNYSLNSLLHIRITNTFRKIVFIVERLISMDYNITHIDIQGVMGWKSTFESTFSRYSSAPKKSRKKSSTKDISPGGGPH